MTAAFNTFLMSESGAVTVDWVVLTAGILLLALGIVVPIGTTLTTKSDAVGNYIETMSIATY